MASIAGKVIIVTGSSSGIGAALSKRFVEAGAKVVGLARRQERLQELEKSFQGAPGKFHGIKTDLTKEIEILHAFDWVKRNLGAVDVLVNNAGIARQNSTLLNGTTEDWKATIDTNLIAVAICSREAIKIMREKKIDGHIINVNSVVGHFNTNSETLNIYPASKHALAVYTERIRVELARANIRIRVSSLSPGAVKTEITGIPPEQLQKMLSDGGKGVLECEDIVDAAMFMLSTRPNVHVTELMIRSLGELND